MPPYGRLVHLRQGIFPGFTRMDHDGFVELGGDFQLALKHGALHIARREIVVVVQADLADSQHFRMAGQIAQARESIGRSLRRIVRMDTDGCVDERVAFRLLYGHIQLAARTDRHHHFHAGGEGALDYLRAIGIEFLVVEVAMRIDQAHFKRAPTAISSWKPARTGFPPSTDAATIIPFDSMPFSLRGCKFATITTLRLSNCSGV